MNKFSIPTIPALMRLVGDGLFVVSLSSLGAMPDGFAPLFMGAALLLMLVLGGLSRVLLRANPDATDALDSLCFIAGGCALTAAGLPVAGMVWGSFSVPVLFCMARRTAAA